ncbi:anti-sigma factor family protein [Nonomuraea sp. NPDC050556]|uniref:anti-sigma factor family protein n=1 Tax=Nonomuraea sp. NPDC050556 TaxID=3364369 RepID=UPI0037A3E99F
MTCAELVELVTAYLDGELADRERFEAHLAECEGCERYLDQFRTVASVVGDLVPPPPDPGVRDRLLAAFRDWYRT